VSNSFDEGIKFYDRIYKGAILLFVVIGVIEIFWVAHELDTRTTDIQKSINCVVTLFTHPNRTGLAISSHDINNCTLTRQ
jgi:hypothetical protein